MLDVSTNSTHRNIRLLFIHLSDVHTYNTRFSSARNFHIQESRLLVQLKSFSTLGARLWNCLHPDLAIFRLLTAYLNLCCSNIVIFLAFNDYLSLVPAKIT